MSPRLVVPLAVLLALTVSCAGDRTDTQVAAEPASSVEADSSPRGAAPTARTATPSSTTESEDESLSPFVEPETGDVVERDGAGGQPNGNQAGAGRSPEAGDGAIADDQPAEARDPCNLVPVGDFARWIDATTAEQHMLEAGQACGYTGGDDTLRMALALLRMSPGSAWLPPDQPFEGISVDGHPAQWSPGYPVPESSVLVVQLEGHQLVIEVSSRQRQHADDHLRDGALNFAATAIDRYGP